MDVTYAKNQYFFINSFCQDEFLSFELFDLDLLISDTTSLSIVPTTVSKSNIMNEYNINGVITSEDLILNPSMTKDPSL